MAVGRSPTRANRVIAVVGVLTELIHSFNTRGVRRTLTFGGLALLALLALLPALAVAILIGIFA